MVFTSEIITADNNVGYGFNVYADGVLLCHQYCNADAEGLDGYATVEDAQAAADAYIAERTPA